MLSPWEPCLNRVLASLLCAVGASAAAAAQQPPPQFRSGVDLMTIDVTVTTADGRPVADLGAGDFVVSVGGQPRKVLMARFSGASGRATAAPPARMDSPAALVSNARTAFGRNVLIVVDRDSIQTGGEKSLLMAAGGLLDALGAADAAGVVGLPSGRLELTREHDRVRRELSRMTGTMPSNGWRWHITWEEAAGIERRDNRLLAQVLYRECSPAGGSASRVAEGCDRDVVSQANDMLRTARSQAQTTLANLGAIADGLTSIRGPKHLVLISGGLRFDQELLLDFARFAGQAARAGIVLHVIHADQPPTDSATARRAVTSAFGSREMSEGLTAIAGTTGGAYFHGIGSATGVFERIAGAIINGYELALETTSADVAAGVRDVKVSVTRDGLRVRGPAKVALTGRARPHTEALADLLRQPTDLGGLPIEVATFVSRGDDPDRLRVTIAAAVETGLPAVPGEWGFTVLDQGNVVASGHRPVSDAAAGTWPASAAAILTPGRYRLRFAALAADGRAGTVDVPLYVGLRAVGELQASDLIVGVAAAGRLQPRARVARGTDLHAMIEVMCPDAARLAQSRAVIEITPAGAAEPVQRHLMAARSGPNDMILVNEARIRTHALPPGRYTASVIVLIDAQPTGRVSRWFELIVPDP